MSEEVALLTRYEQLLDYELSLREAEDDLIRFAEITMPNSRDVNNPHSSEYVAAKHHRFMAEMMMAVERGEKLKVITNVPPRHGKSELCTKRFAAWFSARNPAKDIIVATYSEKFALDFAKEIRNIVTSQRFRQVFPGYRLTSKSAEHMQTSEGGDIFCLGRRSATTGRGGDLIIVDDPTKDDREVKYVTFREDCWQWFTQTLLTRRHHDRAPIAVTQTRWNEDDIVGRITDPNNPAYSERFASGFEVIDLPAIALDEDPLGRKPGEALWPERFGLPYLQEMRDANPVSFSALYQSDPTPEDGVYYRAEEIYEYDRTDLPESLQKYVVSDHAVTTAAVNDRTVLLPFGICASGIAWVLPGTVWKRMDASEAVEQMLEMIDYYKPSFWYAEKGHISKSLGPFLRKRMEEEGVFVPFVEEQPVGDKLQRSHSARARCAQGLIRFPRFAPWWPRAKAELLKFPNGRFDDFADCISMIGMKLNSQSRAGRPVKKSRFEEGTYGSLLAQFRDQDRRRRFEQDRAGW